MFYHCSLVVKHRDKGGPTVIKRFPGLSPTRSRTVVHNDLVFTVAVALDPVTLQCTSRA
jgi:hypothetical protein